MSPNNKSKKKEAAKLLSEMNYTYVDWNCLNNNSVRKYSKSQLLNNLKKSISYLKSEGYEFHNFYDFVN